MTKTNGTKESKVWVIGGGKGGTGKSFVTSSIGTYLAKKGKKVTLIDGDIGGANLHSFFGLKKPQITLSNFFEQKIPLENIKKDMEIENLSLISGDIQSLASDEIKFFQKRKFLRQMKELDSEYTIVDVGAGSHRNILDTFLIADKMIAVMTPEILSIENMYHFVKNAIFRKLRLFLRASGFKEIILYIWGRREINKIKNLKELVDYLREFPDIANVLDKEIQDFKIYLVMNKVRNNEEMLVGASIKSTLKKFLGIEAHYVGFIEYDDSIRKSVRSGRPFILNYPRSHCTKEVVTLVQNLIADRELNLMRE